MSWMHGHWGRYIEPYERDWEAARERVWWRRLARVVRRLIVLAIAVATISGCGGQSTSERSSQEFAHKFMEPLRDPGQEQREREHGEAEAREVVRERAAQKRATELERR